MRNWSNERLSKGIFKDWFGINVKGRMAKRNIFLSVFSLITLCFYFNSIRALVTLSYGSDVYEYILLIPFISGYFLFKKFKIILKEAVYSFMSGSAFFFLGIIIWVLQMAPFISICYHSLSMKILSMVLVFIGGMVCLFGTQLLKNALFPVLFLLLMVPLPSAIIDWIISFFQVGTAAFVDVIFKLIGIPYFRDGLSFHLPNLSINIAPECSGIHSSTALIITGFIAGHLFLRTLTGKTILILLTIPLVLVKNGIRVATLTLLGAYVNMSFINGDLHHKGGFVFFLIALVLLFGVMFLIKKIELITHHSPLSPKPPAKEGQ
jgi:exosortase